MPKETTTSDYLAHLRKDELEKNLKNKNVWIWDDSDGFFVIYWDEIDETLCGQE